MLVKFPIPLLICLLQQSRKAVVYQNLNVILSLSEWNGSNHNLIFLPWTVFWVTSFLSSVGYTGRFFQKLSQAKSQTSVFQCSQHRGMFEFRCLCIYKKNVCVYSASLKPIRKREWSCPTWWWPGSGSGYPSAPVPPSDSSTQRLSITCKTSTSPQLSTIYSQVQYTTIRQHKILSYNRECCKYCAGLPVIQFLLNLFLQLWKVPSTLSFSNLSP